MTRIALLLVFFAAAAASAAPFVNVDGRVDGGIDGVFDVLVEVRDDDGVVRSTMTETGVVVLDGAFAVDLDIADVVADLERGAVMTIDVEIGELRATARLGAMFSAAESSTAATATTAATASTLGVVEPASLIQFSTLDDAGGVVVAFANVTGVPAGVADGIDNGTLDAVGTGLAVTGGTLRLTGVTGANIIDRSIPTAAIANGSMTTTQIGPMVATVVADATLTGADFADGAVASLADIGTPDEVAIFEQNVACAAAGGERLVMNSTCTRRTCGSAGRVPCGSSAGCQEPSTGLTTCQNVRLGVLLFAP